MSDVRHETTQEPQDFSQFWRIPEGDSELLVAHYNRQTFGRHAHERYAIGVISGGAEKLFYRGSYWYGTPGSVVAITPTEIHDGVAADEQGWRYQMIYVDPTWLNEKVLHGQVPADYLHLFRQPLRQDPELAREILYRHRMIQRSGLSLERETILIELLAKVFGRYGLPMPEQDASEREAVRRVKQRLDRDFDQDITLTELGTLVNMDPLYLIRVFRKEAGIAPHSYQLQRRIARAQQLLRIGMGIADAALACGFYDQSHMARFFKKIVGVTPGAFRAGTTSGRVIVYG
ncbi:MAG: AraC family transcriptional regulator [Pseudomonadota bacterium]